MLILFCFFLKSINSRTVFNISDEGVLLSLTSDDATVQVPKNVTRILERSFANLPCQQLTFETGSLLTTCDYESFTGSNIVEATFPPSLKQAPTRLFYNVTSLIRVIFQGNITEISYDMFARCSRLSVVSIGGVQILANGILDTSGSVLKSILYNAFMGVSLREIRLHSGIINPWEFGFQNHPTLIRIYGHSPITYLRHSMFLNCSDLIQISDNKKDLLLNGELDLNNLPLQDNYVTDVFVGVPVTTLVYDEKYKYPEAFWNSLPDVTTFFYHGPYPDPFIIPSVCRYFKNLNSISIRGFDIMVDRVIDISHAPMTQLGNDCFYGIDVISVDLPHTLTSLPNDLFFNCRNLVAAVIPLDLTEIPYGCFCNCQNLAALVINGVNLINQNVLDFAGSSITSFGFESFRGVESIYKIVFDGYKVISFKDFAFGYCTNLNEIQFLTAPVGFDLASLASPFRNTKLTYVTIPFRTLCSKLPQVDSTYLFFQTPIQNSFSWISTSRCVNTSSGSVPSVPNWEFHSLDAYRLVRCTDTTSDVLTVPMTVAIISTGAFSLTRATTLQFEEYSYLVQIDEYAFNGSSFANIIFPRNYSTINYALFHDNTNIQNATFLSNYVYVINSYAFSGATNLKTFFTRNTSILMDGVLNLTVLHDVGRNGFTGVKFETIEISEVIYDYGSIGISQNPYVKTVIIRGTIDSFPAYMFDKCYSLSSIIVDGRVILDQNTLDLRPLLPFRLGYYSFAESPIEKLIFANGANFHYEAFYGCNNLTYVEYTSSMQNPYQIPPQLINLRQMNTFVQDGKTIISNNVLDLRNVAVSQITSFSLDAFADLSIVTAYLPPNPVRLSSGIFDGCFSLQSVYINSSVREIPDRAFRDCINLTSIQAGNFPIINSQVLNLSTMHRIGDEAFFANFNIKTIVINATDVILGDYAFATNPTLTTVRFTNLSSGGLYVGQGDQPFDDTPNLASVEISEQLNCYQIGELSFQDVFSGSALANKTWADFGCDDNYDFLTLDANDRDRVIRVNTSLPIITIPSHVKILAEFSFSRCLSNEVRFQPGSRLEVIEPLAFQGSQFQKITFPESLTTIPTGFFSNNSNINTVVFNGNISEIPSNAFSYSPNLQYVSIMSHEVLDSDNFDISFSPITKFAANSFKGLNLRRFIIPRTVSISQDLTFSDQPLLAEVSIPTLSFTIPSNMFRGCTSLSFVAISNLPLLYNQVLDLVTGNITRVGDYAFSGVRLREIVSSQRTNLSSNSFNGVVGTVALRFNSNPSTEYFEASLDVPEIQTIILVNDTIVTSTYVNLSTTSFTWFSERRFSRSNFTEIILPSTLSALNASLFASSTKLQSVTFSGSVVSFSDSLFIGCSSLSFIKIEKTVIFQNGVLDLSSQNNFEVRDHAFEAVTAITKISLPGAISLRDSSFGQLQNLRTVTFTEEPTSITFSGRPFVSDSNLANVQLPSKTQCQDSFVNFTLLFAGSSASSLSWESAGCTSGGGSGGTSSSSSTSSTAVIALAVILVIVLLCGIVLVVIFCIRSRRQKLGFSSLAGDEPERNQFGKTLV